MCKFLFFIKECLDLSHCKGREGFKCKHGEFPFLARNAGKIPPPLLLFLLLTYTYFPS